MITRSLTKLWLTIVVANDGNADCMMHGQRPCVTCFSRANLSRIWRVPRGSSSSTWNLPRDSSTPSWRAEKTKVLLLRSFKKNCYAAAAALSCIVTLGMCTVCVLTIPCAVFTASLATCCLLRKSSSTRGGEKNSPRMFW